MPRDHFLASGVGRLPLQAWVLVAQCLYPEETAQFRVASKIFMRVIFPHLIQVLLNLSLLTFAKHHDLDSIENKYFNPFLTTVKRDLTKQCAKVWSLLHLELPRHWSAYTDPLLVIAACRESIITARFGTYPNEPQLALVNWLRNPVTFAKSLPLLDPREVEPGLFKAVREYVKHRPWEKRDPLASKRRFDQQIPEEIRELGEVAVEWLEKAIAFNTKELRYCLDEARFLLSLLHLARKTKTALQLSSAQRRILLYAKLVTRPLWQLRGEPPPVLDEDRSWHPQVNGEVQPSSEKEKRPKKKHPFQTPAYKVPRPVSFTPNHARKGANQRPQSKSMTELRDANHMMELENKEQFLTADEVERQRLGGKEDPYILGHDRF